MDENDLAYSKQVLAEYKRIRHIIQFGDLYRLASPYTHQQIAIMYEYQDKAILFAWLTDKHLTDTHPPLLLQGLDAASRYHLRELTPDTDGLLTDLHNQNVGGDFLMLSGISIHWKHHLQSLCMELVRL
jgi:alpha-galactosidase